jgi:nucleotide-binding universal stress UspA family protein
MKVPPLGSGAPTLGIIVFEMEQMILPALSGPHVPRFVATGAAYATPYIVMERIDSRSLAELEPRFPLPVDDVVRIGARIADAVHSVHAQHVIHFDLKPENVLLRAGEVAVLIDFGFARHEHFPDLIAEERDFAAGSSAYVSPEQLGHDRSDARSDIFALGVLLYAMATGEKPFGEPQTIAGMRDRLWRTPAPPRSLRNDIPPWLQEIVLRCLEPASEARYQSAAHVALDLRHPEGIPLTERATRIEGSSFGAQLGRWWRARGSLRDAQARRPAVTHRAPVIMVAVDTEHPDDERHPALQGTTRQIISLSDEFRLMCVSVISAPPLGGGGETATTTGKHLEHKARLRHWVEPLRLPPGRISLHVVESANAADTLLELARSNHVNLIVLGAPGPSQRALAWWRSVASTVTANADCSVHVVRVPERGPEGDA